jgi:hypothetical protein
MYINNLDQSGVGSCAVEDACLEGVGRHRHLRLYSKTQTG